MTAPFGLTTKAIFQSISRLGFKLIYVNKFGHILIHDVLCVACHFRTEYKHPAPFLHKELRIQAYEHNVESAHDEVKFSIILLYKINKLYCVNGYIMITWIQGYGNDAVN